MKKDEIGTGLKIIIALQLVAIVIQLIALFK